MYRRILLSVSYKAFLHLIPNTLVLFNSLFVERFEGGVLGRRLRRLPVVVVSVLVRVPRRGVLPELRLLVGRLLVATARRGDEVAGNARQLHVGRRLGRRVRLDLGESRRADRRAAVEEAAVPEEIQGLSENVREADEEVDESKKTDEEEKRI